MSEFDHRQFSNLSPENEDEAKILACFMEAFLLRRRKGKDYGDSWKGLGYKGEFPFIYGKVERLKKILWEDNLPANESARDSLVDLLNHIVHTLVLVDEERKKC